MTEAIDEKELYQDHDTGAEVPAGDMLAARKAAVDILYAVLSQKQALGQALERDAGFADLPSRDKAFCRMIVSTTLRRLGQIDDILARAEDKPGRTAPLLTLILRMALAQILFMDVADHAAVDTAVRLAEAAGMERQKGFVNGVLRNIVRSGKEWLSRQDETRLNTPEWLLKIWIEDYGMRGAAEIARANLIEAPLDISLRDEADRTYFASTFQATELGAGTLRRASGGLVSALEGFDEGRWWVQDASAAIPARLFGELKERTVVDLCAAPGGKTLQMAAQGAHVVALDRSAGRMSRLRDNLERMRLQEQVETIVADAGEWRPAEAPDFILLDAPCSATGTVRRNPDVLHHKSLQDIERLAAVQEAILENAFDMLAPGGLLVYCTCSLQKEEGEYQIARFLERHDNASKIAISASEIGGMDECVSEDGDLRILPYHRAAQGGMDGFFVSRLTKR